MLLDSNILIKLKIPDAAIAGTAFVYNIPLVTQDKIFRKIKKLSVIEP